MEMKNEILFATSDEFYYDGIPSQGSYTSSTTQVEESVMSRDSATEFKEIEAELVFTQITFVTVAVICLLKGILNSMNNKKIANSENDLSGENNKNIKKKATVPYYVISIIFFIGYGIVNMVKGFIPNIK